LGCQIELRKLDELAGRVDGPSRKAAGAGLERDQERQLGLAQFAATLPQHRVQFGIERGPPHPVLAISQDDGSQSWRLLDGPV
jgi:hypothetical protein